MNNYMIYPHIVRVKYIFSFSEQFLFVGIAIVLQNGKIALGYVKAVRVNENER